MQRMQQEAAERVRSMQRRARLYVHAGEEEPHQEEAHRTAASHQEAESALSAPPSPSPALRAGEGKPKQGGASFLSALTGDKERLLLLMLAVLLAGNEADIELVVALLYLAM